MCGILAVLDLNNRNIDKALLIRMRDSMYHRGPDDAGLYLDGSVGLGHRRLAIIDLSESGHQPMTNEDHTLFLVCNGEIYNYIELRADLKKRGHRFHSTSDSEVIIHQYEEDGLQCLDKFNGMFSFALWDSKEKKLFAARDRLGIKPLYYFNDGKKIVLASEIKAIIADLDVPRVPNYQAIADYVFAGRALGNKTMFKKIEEIEPGYYFTVNAKKRHVQIRKYWDIHYNYNYARTDEELREELFSLVDDAVRIHCRSDATLGCHLSGGLDSSTIVALAARYRESLKTFSIKFSEDDFINETSYAKQVAKHVEADYIEGSPSATDFARLLPFLMWHMDLPMATDGGFSYFTVSKLAQEDVKVSLTGHGGDELFAGYPAQFQAAYQRRDMFANFVDPFRVPRSSIRGKLVSALLHKKPSDWVMSFKKRLGKEQGGLEDLWIQLHCSALPENNGIFRREFIRSLEGYSPREDYIAPLLNVDTEQTLDKCLYHDLRVYLPGLLHLEDRVSMAVSIESRVPLLDYRIVEFLASVPPEQKIKNMQPKYLLRSIASSLLPEPVLERKDKFPFPVPGKFWLSKEMKEMRNNILLSPGSLSRGVFKAHALKEGYNNIDMSWPQINIELWFKIFVDRDKTWTDLINPTSESYEDSLYAASGMTTK